MSFRRWCYQRGVRWHAQNLNELPGSTDHKPRLGPMWQYGRAWINVWRGDGDTGRGYREILEINPEWHVKPRASAGLGFEIGGDSNHEVLLSLDLGLARFYLSVDSPYLRPILRRIQPGHWFDLSKLAEPYRKNERHWLPDPVEVAVRWHDGGLWWSFWQHPHEWSSRTPKWRSGHFDPIDQLLGRHVYSSLELSTETVEVPMPEKTYAGTVKLTLDTWKRPRWPFGRSLPRATIEVADGVPHPGKGENSWDCDEDATYSLTCAARTAEQAVAKLVESVLDSRRRYGGRNWRPAEVRA
jgi:hypothetical protein